MNEPARSPIPAQSIAKIADYHRNLLALARQLSDLLSPESTSELAATLLEGVAAAFDLPRSNGDRPSAAEPMEAEDLLSAIVVAPPVKKRLYFNVENDGNCVLHYYENDKRQYPKHYPYKDASCCTLRGKLVQIYVRKNVFDKYNKSGTGTKNDIHFIFEYQGSEFALFSTTHTTFSTQLLGEIANASAEQLAGMVSVMVIGGENKAVFAQLYDAAGREIERDFTSTKEAPDPLALLDRVKELSYLHVEMKDAKAAMPDDIGFANTHPAAANRSPAASSAAPAAATTANRSPAASSAAPAASSAAPAASSAAPAAATTANRSPAASSAAPAAATTATQTMQYDLAIAETNRLLKELGWTPEEGRKYLLKNYGKRSRQLLDDAELFDFIEKLKARLYAPESNREFDENRDAIPF
jgi:hypothetical protein